MGRSSATAARTETTERSRPSMSGRTTPGNRIMFRTGTIRSSSSSSSSPRAPITRDLFLDAAFFERVAAGRREAGFFARAFFLGFLGVNAVRDAVGVARRAAQ